MKYKPWGPFDWLSGKLEMRDWAILGTIATEERCLAVPEAIGRALGERDFFVRIEDPEPAEPTRLMASLDAMQATFHAMPGDSLMVRADLLSDIDTMREVAEGFIARSGGKIILDVSAMPKYWFFP